MELNGLLELKSELWKCVSHENQIESFSNDAVQNLKSRIDTSNATKLDVVKENSSEYIRTIVR